MSFFSIHIQPVGNYKRVYLQNDTEHVQVELYTFGAIVNAFTFSTKKGVINIIDGFSSIKEAEQTITHGFKSAFLSPFTCRMKNGKYSFNNQTYTTNKFFLQQHAIHGLLYDAPYTIKNTESTLTHASVEMEYAYKGTENGYPFHFTVNHVFTLQQHHQLTISTTVTNMEFSVLPYAQGWHPYFTLGQSIDDCLFTMNSNTMVVFDETLIPTGMFIPDSRFTTPQQLHSINLDNCFVLQEHEQHLACTLENNNVALHIYANRQYPYLQVYTPPHRNSMAIENLSGIPDCFNNGVGLTLIEPNSSTIFVATYQAFVK